MLEVGQEALSFCMPNQDEVEICSRDLAGKWIVLYFYPKDNTPGCTTQACDFTRDKDMFEDADAIILGVSGDSAKKHRNFIEKKELTITLLVDDENAVAKEYGVWGPKKFMGKEYDGIIRSTFIINPEGMIAATWTSVRTKAHSEIVIAKLKELQA
jgi:thioredoxin-dependent peroxiredoxin